jgi:hypothetical protein
VSIKIYFYFLKIILPAISCEQKYFCNWFHSTDDNRYDELHDSLQFDEINFACLVNMQNNSELHRVISVQNCVILHTNGGGGVLLNNSNCGGIDPQWTRKKCKIVFFCAFRYFWGLSNCCKNWFWFYFFIVSITILLLISFAKIDFYKNQSMKNYFSENNSIKKFYKNKIL